MTRILAALAATFIVGGIGASAATANAAPNPTEVTEPATASSLVGAAHMRPDGCGQMCL